MLLCVKSYFQYTPIFIMGLLIFSLLLHILIDFLYVITELYDDQFSSPWSLILNSFSTRDFIVVYIERLNSDINASADP